jgi:hypothetical protein
MTFSSLISNVAKTLSNNSPVILTTIGITGGVTSAYLTGRASFKAATILNEEPMHLPLKEKTRIVWTLYIPAVGTGIVSIVCLISATRIGTKRVAAMAAFASISEKALIEYKEKVLERLGARKEETMRAEIAQDNINNNPVSNNEVIFANSNGILCYDSITGRYFVSDVETLRKAENTLNHSLVHNLYATLNEFYNLIGLPTTPYGSEVGWNANKLVELKFSTVLSEDDRPCLSIDYNAFPIRNYQASLQ